MLLQEIQAVSRMMGWSFCTSCARVLPPRAMACRCSAANDYIWSDCSLLPWRTDLQACTPLYTHVHHLQVLLWPVESSSRLSSFILILRLTHEFQVARLAGIEPDIVSKARLAGQQIEDKLQVNALQGIMQCARQLLLIFHKMQSSPPTLSICLSKTGIHVLLVVSTRHSARETSSVLHAFDTLLAHGLKLSILCMLSNVLTDCHCDQNRAIKLRVDPLLHASQVSFAADDVAPLTDTAVPQLKHVLFACNASLSTFTEAWKSMQRTAA